MSTQVSSRDVEQIFLHALADLHTSFINCELCLHSRTNFLPCLCWFTSSQIHRVGERKEKFWNLLSKANLVIQFSWFRGFRVSSTCLFAQGCDASLIEFSKVFHFVLQLRLDFVFKHVQHSIFCKVNWKFEFLFSNSNIQLHRNFGHLPSFNINLRNFQILFQSSLRIVSNLVFKTENLTENSNFNAKKTFSYKLFFFLTQCCNLWTRPKLFVTTSDQHPLATPTSASHFIQMGVLHLGWA